VELEPAFKLGLLPPERVVLSAEALSFLNTMIEVWYEEEVELVTVEVHPEARKALSPLQDVQYSSPFRPVTGLNLIITPTVQWSMSRREQHILHQKAKWGVLGRFSLLAEAHRLVIKEVIPTLPGPRKGRGKQWTRKLFERTTR